MLYIMEAFTCFFTKKLKKAFEDAGKEDERLALRSSEENENWPVLVKLLLERSHFNVLDRNYAFSVLEVFDLVLNLSATIITYNDYNINSLEI